MPLYSVDDHEHQRQAFMRSRHENREAVDTSPDRVYELIRAGLRDGSITSSDQLVEHLLVKTYGASRNSVRRALQMLTNDGLLTREPRAGTNPTRDFVPVHVGEIGPRAWSGTSYDGRLDVTTVTCDRIAPAAELRRRLQADSGHVIIVEQLGRLDGLPLYFRIGFVPSPLTPSEFRAQLDELHQTYPPLPVAFHRMHGREYGGSTYTVEAVAANERVATELGIDTGSPILLRELTTIDIEDRPGELSFTYFTPGRVALTGEGAFTITDR